MNGEQKYGGRKMAFASKKQYAILKSSKDPEAIRIVGKLSSEPNWDQDEFQSEFGNWLTGGKKTTGKKAQVKDASINISSTGNDANRGYSGYSMSNRAVEAYSEGRMPYSKWNKGTTLGAIQEKIDDGEITKATIEDFQKMPQSMLKEYLTSDGEWHHTSKFFNQTDFYGLNMDALEDLTTQDIDKKLQEIKYNQNLERAYKSSDQSEEEWQQSKAKYESEHQAWASIEGKNGEYTTYPGIMIKDKFYPESMNKEEYSKGFNPNQYEKVDYNEINPKDYTSKGWVNPKTGRLSKIEYKDDNKREEMAKTVGGLADKEKEEQQQKIINSARAAEHEYQSNKNDYERFGKEILTKNFDDALDYLNTPDAVIWNGEKLVPINRLEHYYDSARIDYETLNGRHNMFDYYKNGEVKDPTWLGNYSGPDAVNLSFNDLLNKTMLEISKTDKLKKLSEESKDTKAKAERYRKEKAEALERRKKFEIEEEQRKKQREEALKEQQRQYYKSVEERKAKKLAEQK